MATTTTNPHKNRYTLPTVSLLALFILSLFYFSKRALEPKLSLYTDLYSGLSSPTLSPPKSDISTNAISPDQDNSRNTISPDEENSRNTISSDEDNSRNTTSPDEDDSRNAISPDEDESRYTTEPVDQEQVKVEEKKYPVLENGTPVNTLVNGNGNGLVEGMKWAQDCNFYVGKWVMDEVNYPVYKPGSCPFVDEAYDCQSNGRKDSQYTNWRWKPDGCGIPRFNAIDFLSRIRGKRLLLVGDSMNRNQFESLLCLLYEGLSNKSKMYETHGYKITKGRGYYIFKFEDYDCTVEFVRSHFLVKEGLRYNARGNSSPTLSIDKIDKSAGRWKRADILIFNTGHWWTHGKTARGQNYYKEGDYIYPKFDAVEAYKKAMRTWGRWIDKNVNPGKLVFYRGYSSAHFRGGDWDSGGTCIGETEPIKTGAILDSYPLKMKIVQEVIQEMKFPVVLLNVTKLTNFRKDGHPSVYGKNMTMNGGKKVSTRRQDCSHWCLPGVPDAWNELIYATLVRQNRFWSSILPCPWLLPVRDKVESKDLRKQHPFFCVAPF